MENSKAINIAAGCVMASGLEEEEKQLVIATLRNLEKRLNYCIVCGDVATEVVQNKFYCEDCC